MQSAFRLLILLVGLSPFFLFSDSLLFRGALGGYAALMVFVVAWSIRPGEAAFLATLLKPAVLLALVPTVWLLLQALPIPFDSLRHPIWISAEAALGRPIGGSISVNPGDTLIALARYLSVLAILFVASAVTIDRQRAETFLFLLAGVTTLLAALLIIHDLGGFVFLGEISAGGARTAVAGAAALGTVLTCATATYAIERYETRRNRGDFGPRLFITALTAALGAFAVCWIAVVFFTSNGVIFATACGVGTFILIAGFRRLGVPPRIGMLLMLVAIAVPASMIARDLLAHTPDLTLRFDTTSSKPALELTQRIVNDTGWLGSGAGTFSALLPIYQETGQTIVAATAPTTAAGLLVELGRPALWIAVIATVAAVAWLLSGAFQRGRDSFFTAAGASCAVLLSIQAFVDASLLKSTIVVLAASLLGLALSQSASRTLTPS